MKGNRKTKIYMHVANITLIVIGLLMYCLAQRTMHFMMDDFWYSTKLYEETPIQSFKDIVDAQVWHFNNWGGRTIAHTILQLVLLGGETVADVLNVFVTVALAYVICVVSDCKKPMAVLAAGCLMIGCNANWKMSMFWQAGASNYLYITLPILFFIYCYVRKLQDMPEEKTEVKDFVGMNLWILPLGLIAGWSNENMGPMAWILTVIVMLLLKKQKQRISPWMILGNITCLIGSVLVVVAPGNFVRSAEVAGNQRGTLWNIYLRCYAEGKAALEYLFPILIVLMMMIICAKGILNQTIGKRNLLLLLGALLSWGAMILAPHYPDRAAFGTMILIICVIISLAKKIVKAKPECVWYLWGGMAFMWLRSMYLLAEYIGIQWGWVV